MSAMRAAQLSLVLTLALMLGACRHIRFQPLGRPPVARVAPPAVVTEPLAPSPRLIVGRIIAVDPARRFAFVELGFDAPPASLADGSELLARTEDLRPTGRLRASRYVRDRTLGATIVEGQPSPGDEVVWLAP